MNYQDPAPERVAQLRAARLYPKNLANTDQIANAWIPISLMRKLMDQQREKASSQLRHT